MAKRLCLALAFMTAACSSPRDAASVLRDAQQAMGSVNSIQYSGTGMNAFFGQALTAGQEWPRRDMSSFTRAVNYEQRSARDEMNFAQPTFGGQQQNTQVNGDKAWNVGPNGPAPQLATAEERQVAIWLTPHGFLRGAASANDVVLSGTEGASVISYTAHGKYKLEGTIDAQSHVTKVATKIPNPVMGDTDLIATYSDYKDFSGVKFPTKILVEQGGFPLWDLNVTSVTPNAPVDLPVPEAVASATLPAVQATSTKLANGVWHLTGGSHHSLVVEFNDHLAVIEAPLDEARSEAVIAEARKLGAKETAEVCPDDAPSLRPQRRTAHVRGRGRDHHHASIERAVFPEDADRTGDAESRHAEQGCEDADAAGRDGQRHHHGREAVNRDLRHVRRYAHERIHVDLSARAEDPRRSGRLQPGATGRAGSANAAAQRRHVVRRNSEVEIECRDDRPDPRPRRGDVRRVQKIRREVGLP
jgi:hypothetical protein